MLLLVKDFREDGPENRSNTKHRTETRCQDYDCIT